MIEISSELIRRCKLEDRRSQKELYLLLLPYLRATCYRYTTKKADLKDILQEAFLLIFRKINQFDSNKGNFHSWAARIAINTTFNYNKRVSVNNEDEFKLQYHEHTVEPEVYKKLSDEELMEMMNAMPKNYFDVFNLYVIDEYQHDEIAALLKISPALSRKRLSRAKQWLVNAILKKKSASSFDIVSKSLTHG